MKNGFCTLLIIFLTIFLSRCANVGQPTGGPKDIEPPRLTTTYPNDQALNFNDNKIQFIFSEPIKVEDVKKQIIITPPIEDEAYVLKIKNNLVTFQLKERLQPNTTYTINMGEAVRDITENNKAKNVKLGFSTGSFIDSLKITGRVTHLMQGKPALNAIVGLYNADDTLNIFNKRPLFLTRTDSSGNYQLSNLKNGNFRIYAFLDKNDNLRNDPLTEAFGFKEDVIQLDSSINDVNIRLFRQDNRDLKMQSSRPDGQYFLIKFNKYVKNYDLSSNNSGVNIFHNIIEENKTIRVYNTFSMDSIKASIVAFDTLDNKLEEEVTIKFITSRKPLETFSYTSFPSENERINENFKIEFSFTKPVIKVVTDSMFFQYDSLNIVNIDPETDFSWNKTKDKLILQKRLNKDLVSKNISTEASPQQGNRSLTSKPANEGAVQLYMAAGSFISVENDSSININKKFRFINPQETGTIEGNIETEVENFLIQLVDKNFKVISEIKNKKKYRFENLKPGEYKIRIFIDNDGDGSWTPGNINEFREPEDVVFLEELITIRGNWEMKDVNIRF
ncbi:MAG: Ig-like domain-containing domain [Bacteroidota bacterium]|jgi:uncharacterized protein (DUF2141 family)|nr:Ig-like domain-containing domain [Bacteroidota bacterium]